MKPTIYQKAKHGAAIAGSIFIAPAMIFAAAVTSIAVATAVTTGAYALALHERRRDQWPSPVLPTTTPAPAGWLLCTVALMQDCETLGAFRVGEVAYQCEQQGRGW